MARIKINGETPFQVLAHSFSVSPSSEGYTLNYSADGINYDAWDEATPANENLFVLNVPKLSYFKLVGNGSNVIINY